VGGAGLIYALDLGVRTGWCKGRPGAEAPASGSVRLKDSDEDRAVAFAELLKFLNEEWSTDRPAMVVKERMFSLQASAERNNSEAMVRMHAGLHAVVEALCLRFRIPFDRDRHEPADSTVRKHFIGRGRMGTRDETKAAVVRRCHVLNLMPGDSADDNRADAIAVWDWAASTYARRAASTERLFFFGERPQR